MSSLRTPIVGSGSCQMRALKRILLGAATAITLAVLTSCDTPGVTLVDPDVAGDGDRGLTITVRLEDSTLARALGWSEGVPDAEVFLNRIGDEFDPITLRTDSTGTAMLETMLHGQYRIAAIRVLREDETSPTGDVVRAFGDGLKVYPAVLVELMLRMDQAGSLLISEMQGDGRFTPDAQYSSYKWFHFFELYNNSDTTIYLDGMLWGQAFGIYRDYAPYPCAVTEQWRTDPSGVCAMCLHRFPGTGSQYPLLPAQIALVALDAADHSMVHPNLPDLSAADFELKGTADADNPDVPNLIQVGTRSSFSGHGLGVLEPYPYFIAESLDLGALQRRVDPFGGAEWLNIPAGSLLDVVMDASMDPATDQLAPSCAQYVPRFLDRLEAASPLNGDQVTLTLQRRALRVAQGIVKLQDLNVSFLDFHEAERTPGWIEY